MRIKDQKIEAFLLALASKSPTPGGGSVSAFAGALAASLVAKVARLTVGKKGYEKYWQKFEKIILQAELLSSSLTDLADKDAEAYKDVVAHFSARQKELDQALKHAAEVPLQTAQKAREVLKLAQFALKHGNKNASSDAQVAIFLSRAAIKGAIENVTINLKEIENERFKKEIEGKMRQLSL